MSFNEVFLFGNLNIYIIPPLLSLFVSLVIIYIALLKSKIKTETTLFIIFCVFWSLLSPVFISHHIFRGNERLILTIERTVHFFYVYTPAICLLYFFRITNTKSRFLIKGAFVLSFAISIFTPTEYYIPSLNKYSWGYMGNGGIAFIIFGFYAAATLIYATFFFITRIRNEENQLLRLKLKYIIASYLVSGILSILNYPAIVGIDFYPPGNFSFIPLSFLAYGVLRYRLFDFSIIIQKATLWAFISTLLTLPNILALFIIYPYLDKSNSGLIIIVGIFWFFINYFLFKILHSLLERVFDRRKIELAQIESDFIESAYSLKTYEELADELTSVLKKALSFRSSELVICAKDEESIPGFGNTGLSLSSGLKKWMSSGRGLVEIDLIEYYGIDEKTREELQELSGNYKAKYIIPLIQHGIIVALLFLSEKTNAKPLTPDEVLFLKNVKSSAAISLANSIMFSDLSKLKEKLDARVKEKTEDLEKSMKALQGVVDSLEKEVQDNVVSFFTGKKMDEIIRYIEHNYTEEISRESLAKKMNLNGDYLGRMFKKYTKKNLADYINECRLKKACELLIHSDDNIVDIAFAVGFESLPTFYRAFKKVTNETPINYRAKYK